MSRWSWAAFDAPWQSLVSRGHDEFHQAGRWGGDDAGTTVIRSFPAAGAARADLQETLDRARTTGRECAQLLRTGGQDGELLIWNLAADRGWMVFGVPEGCTTRQAAVDTHAAWIRRAHACFLDFWAARLDEDPSGVPGIWFPRDSTIAVLPSPTNA